MTDADEFEIHQHKRTDKTYFSPRIPIADGRTLRIASKVLDGEALVYAKEKGELVLRRTPRGRKEIVAKFLEDERHIGVLTIQSFNPETGSPHATSFSFVGDEIPRLLDFFETVRDFEFSGPEKVNITDDELRRLTMSRAQAAALVRDNQELFAEVMKSAMTKDDVVAFAYRRRQVEAFGRLLEDRSYFDEVKVKRACSGDEAVWQRFFERNEWIFGYGLSYLYVSGITPEKLEQVVKGYDMLSGGKRADAVMRTRGMVSALCFAEIKTHETDLLAAKPYRSGCWPPSTELVGAIAQVQGTVAAAMKHWETRCLPKDTEGNPTGEEVFNIKPRAFIVIGTLAQLQTEHGANEEKMRSFELFRNSIEGVEILTFDELYERSRFIVEAHARG